VPGKQANFLNQLVGIWSRLQATQRASIGFFAVLALVGIGSLVYFMNRVEYVVLYRDLNPEDAQAIASRLKELKKDFQVSPDQTMIEVAGPDSEVNKLRLDIAGAGLARSGRVGYEIFDKNQFGMTDFTEQVNYQRALEGELGRTISSLSEVSDARVHLVLSKDSLFEDKKEEAKCSVFVRLRKGRELSKNSISGIVNLVAGAVQGLPTYNVSVVDDEGHVLSHMASGDGIRSDYESGLQDQIEKETIAKVTSILEPVVGQGKVHANASVRIDSDSSEQTEETYNPTPPPVILSQQKSEERVGNASVPSGVPGTRSNQGGAAAQPAAGAPDQSRQNEITNYEVSKLVRHTVQPKGAIARLSVAVLLDHKTVYTKGTDGKTASSIQKHSPQELDAYRGLVLAAIGFDEKRGDTVTLEDMPFFSGPQAEDSSMPLPWYVMWQPYLIPAMKYSAFLALFVMVYLLILRPMRKRILQSITTAGSAALQPQLPVSANRALAPAPGNQALPAGSASNEAAALPAAAPSSEAAAFDAEIERELLRESDIAGAGFRKYDVLKRKVVEHANKDPEQMSQLVRTWIKEKA
jgi:flagellar M-ring protein FliF